MIPSNYKSKVELQNTENISKYVEMRLQEWADWFIRGNTYGIGYPRESAITMIEKSITVKKKKDFKLPILPTNESAEEVEKFVVEMSRQNHQMADALRKYYFGREPTIELKAKDCGISMAQFKIFLRMARQWLAGRMSSFR